MARVAMLVANDLVHDGRVRKTAVSVAGFGHEVTVLGVARGESSPVSLGNVTVSLLELRDPGRERLRAARDACAQAKRERGAAALRLKRARNRRRKQRGLRSLVRSSLELRAAKRELAAADRALAIARRERAEAKSAPRTAYEERARLTWSASLYRLRPDVIHAHDHHPLPVAIEVAQRLRAEGQPVRVIYDAHEYLAGREAAKGSAENWVVEAERRYAPQADAVICVSEPIAELLEAELGLRERPTVVRNLPLFSARAEPPLGLREAVGVANAPLVVYAGGVSVRRGIDVAVRGVALLDDVYLALVVPPDHAYTLELLELADELGIRDRVRVTPLVPVDQVVRFLESASVGIYTPRDDGVSHVALPNKLFEYLHAGLPIVGSDLGEQARFIRDCRIGEVCEAGNAESCARAIRRVLSNPERYLERRAALIEQWSWEAQLPALEGLYARLLG